MRFASLGSGSRGNSLVVQHRETTVLIDCGFSAREAKRRLADLAVEIESLSAIVVTHEHTDHISGVSALARKYRLPVYATAGTSRAAAWSDLAYERRVTPDECFAVGDLQFWPFPVPHDAMQPCQYVVSEGGRRLGILTDTGSITPHIKSQLDGCDALVLECNHDLDMLNDSDYPPYLKQRIAGQYGHLSNQQAADLLCGIDTSKLRHMAAAHLSEKNNSSVLAKRHLSEALRCTENWISVIDQSRGLDWRDL